MPDKLMIDREDSVEFANLSGDKNPIHLSETLARKTLYGNTVVHGVHAGLKLLEFSAAKLNNEISPTQIKLEFRKPLFHGVAFDITDQPTDVDSSSWQFRLVANQRDICILKLEAAFNVEEGENTFSKIDLKQTGPSEPEILSEARGQTPLSLPMEDLKRLFPELSARPKFFSLAAMLLASTRIVGMECPGLHSLLHSIVLHQTDRSPVEFRSQEEDDLVTYKVLRYDTRFNMVEIAVKARNWSGVLTAFVRPTPYSQKSFCQIAKLVESESWKEKHALILGGSRGMGEVAAKMIAASGGKVSISYNIGKFDAAKIVEEILEGGGKASSFHFDVTDKNSNISECIEIESVTDLIYFASPRITKQVETNFNIDEFNKFIVFYIDAFAKVVRNLASNTDKDLSIFWPSTSYIENPEIGLSEYVAAKAAGETQCAYLQSELRNVKIVCPRLTRQKTDQVQSVISIEAEDPSSSLLRFFGRAST